MNCFFGNAIFLSSTFVVAMVLFLLFDAKIDTLSIGKTYKDAIGSIISFIIILSYMYPIANYDKMRAQEYVEIRELYRYYKPIIVVLIFIFMAYLFMLFM